MKKSILFALTLAGVVCMNSCNDDEFLPGNPTMDLKTLNADAFFGDSLPFTLKASDVDVPLSTLKAQLFYGEEKVSETVIRTKTSGSDYSGKIYIPFLANVQDGKATLKYVLQNINFTTTEQEMEVKLVRPDYAYVTLVGEDGIEYKMDRTEAYQYSASTKFPQKMKGYIKTPKAGENSNEVMFGWGNKGIEAGVKNSITFSSPGIGKYTISFNTYSYEASPFVKLLLDGTEMKMIDDDNYEISLALKPGQLVEFAGVPDYDNWWIDSDFFEKQDDGKLKFLPLGGSYRITANVKLKYFRIEALKDGELATLQADGTGAMWVIGNGIGKPSVSAKEVGWTTENGLCMSQMEAKKYQITVVAGRSVKTTGIDFKFFHQRGWGGEFTSTTLTSGGSLIGIGVGGDGKPGDGNLYLLDGKELTAGHIYKIVVDVTKGIDKAVLTVTDEGEQPIEIKNISLGGVKMESVDGEVYSAVLNLIQNQSIGVTGIDNIADWWLNPDYFALSEEGELSFLPLDGSYKVMANLAQKSFSIHRMNGAADATLGDDGHGAVWVMGWGIGSPSLDNQVGWNPGAAYCLPEVAPKKYQLTCTSGPEKGSAMGDRIRFDYLSCKFFYQNGWGGELADDNSLAIAPGSEAYITDKGNIEFADGVQLEKGATYIITIDLTAGNDKGVISFVKK